MVKYTDSYMREHCIDVFFSVSGVHIHVLTGGSLLPPALNDIQRNRTLQETIERKLVQYRETAPEIAPETTPETADNLIARNSVIINYDYWHQVQNQVRETLRTYRFLDFSDNDLSQIIPSFEDFNGHFARYALLGFHSYNCYEVHEDGTATYRKVAGPIKNGIHILSDLDLPEHSIEGMSANAAEMPEMFVM